MNLCICNPGKSIVNNDIHVKQITPGHSAYFTWLENVCLEEQFIVISLISIQFFNMKFNVFLLIVSTISLVTLARSTCFNSISLASAIEMLNHHLISFHR